MSEFAPWHTEMAKETLRKRYFRKDEAGNCIEDWSGMCRRVAKHVAGAEKEEDRAKWEEKFYQLMVKGIFLPNSPTLMNAGIGGGLSACFVVPIEDSMDGIFETLKECALISQSGGGVGCNYSPIRPKGALVGKQNRASGPVSFMSVFDAAGVTIEQSGRRRGANMGILDVTHPDILRFIRAKEVDGTFKNFNFSVAITDVFMNNVLDRPHSAHICYHDKTGPCCLMEDGSWVPVVDGEIPPDALTFRQMFDIICEHAHKNGEPGVFFVDTVNASNLSALQEIDACNPCGEQPLISYGSCNLGSFDLSKMFPDGRLDRGMLRQTVSDAVRFLDDVISVNEYPLSQIAEVAKKYRPIGLGCMGYADLLIKERRVYGSPNAIEYTEYLMSDIKRWAEDASWTLAKERGAYPEWESRGVDMGLPMRRNVSLISFAPTGTLAIMAGCSWGIEPNFYWEYLRQTNDGEWVVRHPLAAPYLENGEPLPKYFVTGNDVAWEDHIKVQAALQKYCDSGISKTVNMPNSATVQDVHDAYMMAWHSGCKGLTVYRDGSRESQVISDAKSGPEAPFDASEELPRGVIARRPERTFGQTVREKTGCGGLYITANSYENGDPCEVFVQTVGNGGCSANSKAIGMLISQAIRSGMRVEDIARTLGKVKCSACKGKDLNGKSCADIIGRTMLQAFGPEAPEVIHSDKIEIKREDPVSRRCPDCSTELRRVSGCFSCDNCGWSKCS